MLNGTQTVVVSPLPTSNVSSVQSSKHVFLVVVVVFTHSSSAGQPCLTCRRRSRPDFTHMCHVVVVVRTQQIDCYCSIVGCAVSDCSQLLRPEFFIWLLRLLQSRTPPCLPSFALLFWRNLCPAADCLAMDFWEIAQEVVKFCPFERLDSLWLLMTGCTFEGALKIKILLRKIFQIHFFL